MSSINNAINKNLTILEHSVDQTLTDFSVGPTVIQFDTSLRDDLNAHDNVTNNSRITIPANVKLANFRVHALVTGPLNDGYDLFTIQTMLNGIFINKKFANAPNDYGNASAGATGDFLSGWIAVTPGDYYEFAINQRRKGVPGPVTLLHDGLFLNAEFL